MLKSSYDKIVTDPIHGQMRIDAFCWALIDTPQFQRLRDLKQLGSAYFVFPGASHNRFEHSLGVSHLSNHLITHLKYEQPELEIDNFDVKTVTLAGLTHDLGHGPFSHIFDSHVIPRLRPTVQWSHEDASESMLEYLVDSNGLTAEQCSEEDVKFIKALIRGHGDYKPHKRFLFDIVNNKRNSVDVDKFDYLARDSYHCGVKVGFDHQRSMQFTRVINDQICWNKNEALNLSLLFQTRFNMFKQIYTHKVGKAIELMLIEALCLADDHLDIGSAIDSPEQYTHLTDAILKEIERSRTPALAASRDILKRIRLRDLYRCAESYLLPSHMAHRVTKHNFTAERILSYATASERKEIKEDDIFPEYLVLDWCFKTENPIDKCRFFNKFNKNQNFDLPKSQLSHLIPSNPQEITLRIYVKQDSMRVPVQKIFHRFINKLEFEYPSTSMSDASVLARDSLDSIDNGTFHGVMQSFGGFTGASREKFGAFGGTSVLAIPSETSVEASSSFGFHSEVGPLEESTNSAFKTPTKPASSAIDSGKRARRSGSNGSVSSADAKIRKVYYPSDDENEDFVGIKGSSGRDQFSSGSGSDAVSRANELPDDYNTSFRNQSPQKIRKPERR